MSAGGITPAGSGRIARLDPFALPVSFLAHDAGADERIRIVDLTHDRVVMRRAVRGIRMAVSVPVKAYRGIAIRPHSTSSESAVTLEHRDPALCLQLFTAAEPQDAVTQWRTWGRMLGLPLFVEHDGELREASGMLGALLIAPLAPRRRRHHAIKKRRPSILMRRKLAMARPLPVHRGAREIVARN